MPNRDTQPLLIIENADVVTPDGIIEAASVIVENEHLAAIDSGSNSKGIASINANRQLLMPGIIDLHSDALEKYIEPRPGSVFPLDTAIIEFDKSLVAWGITTIFHCIAFVYGDGHDRSLRTNVMACRILEKLIELQPWLRTRTRSHLRYDILNLAAIPKLKEYARKGYADLLSFMDHTPGQGQYRDMAFYRERMIKDYGFSEERVDQIISNRLRSRECVSQKTLLSLSQACRENQVSLASHDDDGPEKVAWVRDLKATISEFPVSLEALQSAQENGMWTVLGAPNVLRGRSQSGNLSATEIFASGQGEILASDYAPMSLLHAVFKLYHKLEIPLHEAIKWVSLNPAKAVGIEHQLGSIEVGKQADLILVNPFSLVPHVTMTMTGGQVTYRTTSGALFQNPESPRLPPLQTCTTRT
jgi:alpha-D-ribose 1-methylphosphonate 5-triphosphate diphosphatase